MTNHGQLLFGANVDPSAVSWQDAVGVAEAADRGGLDLITMQDHPYVPRFLDTWTFLSYLGARTDNVRLGTNVANLPLRTPAMLAKAAASLDRLTGGRVELGLGAGATWDGIHAFGLSRKEPAEAVDALEEGIRLIRRFWQAEEKVDFDGEHYQLNGAKTGPAPFHPIPLWIGAYGPRMLGLTGRLGDGWIPSLSYLPPEKVPDRQARIDEAAVEAGRSPDDIRRGYNLMGHLAAAGVTTKPKSEPGGVLTGDVSSWIDRIIGYHLELRMDTFIFWPVAGQEREQVEAFSQDVVPAIKERLSKA